MQRFGGQPIGGATRFRLRVVDVDPVTKQETTVATGGEIVINWGLKSTP